MAKIFVSYSHQDEKWKDHLVSHLNVLQGEGLEVWDDRRIAGGDAWKAEIEQAMAQCDVALLLISRHFLTSKFILGEEVPALLQRREKVGLRVIPVILSSCSWAKVSWLNPIQARPLDGKALASMKGDQPDAALSTLADEIHNLAAIPASSSHPQPSASQSFRIDLNHLPKGAATLFGRRDELAQLNAAWASQHTRIVEVIAPGGVGKTALLRDWLQGFSATDWRGAERIYGWSFYSQGTDAKRQASEDDFLAAALAWFKVAIDPAANPWDKGKALADTIAARRTLLVLDGIEPLQYPPGGPLAGELRAPGVKTLLEHLLTLGAPGLCVLTSREHLTDLEGYERNAQRQHGPVERISLEQLNKVAGAQLLHSLGANRAGEAAIADDDQELQDASDAVQGHALTITLLGRYLKLAHHGDIRRRDQIDFQEADNETLNGHAFRMVATYETWLASTGKEGIRQLEALRLLGFFDRPASAKCLAALRASPAIRGLTKEVVGLSTKLWNITLSRLEDGGLLLPGSTDGSVDAHPLIREYLAHTLITQQPIAWQEGHRRLYVYLEGSTSFQPDDMKGLEPLYQSVVHGCQAGLWEETRVEVFRDRIRRGSDSYSIHKLGAIGADLGAAACFFIAPWLQLAPALTESAKAWLLGEAAFCLRALGRLHEALEPMRASAEMRVFQEDWRNAAAGHSNLSELQLSLGRLAAAVSDGEQAVDYADRSKELFQRIGKRTTLGSALHQLGQIEATAYFIEAEAMLAVQHPSFPWLYSLPGFQYCDLLLTDVERAAWALPEEKTVISEVVTEPANEVAAGLQQRLQEVKAKATKTLLLVVTQNWLLDIALDHLTLGRCAIYEARLNGAPLVNAETEIGQAVSGLRAAGAQEFIVKGLLTRAWLRHLQNDNAGARIDLAEVERIASRGGMKLHLADHYLTRARLFFRDDLAQARADLKQARALIEECGYGRRLPELADAEALIGLA